MGVALQLIRLRDSIPSKLCRVRKPGALNPSGSNVLPLVWRGSLERRMLTQSDNSTKLRNMSLKSPRIALKRSVILPKLTYAALYGRP
ncbi:hypothetical protein AVEN_259998-1 [Araneus ventricosus]|uniref:Uncharacterized protein n=1 Tax=Araneus ventricosus TaxID=182803 RepID=A0A4Y2H5W6_ARAVE|nr:hypothetical protein AVEN_259998-1 [Araneus ventricosus]